LGLLNYCLGGRGKRRADLLQGLLHLACALACLNVLLPQEGHWKSMTNEGWTDLPDGSRSP
jgi:hypothetical protein